MSAIDWLNSGATGSYGTVVEPCNLLGKFPHPGLVMESYLRGATLIEAYWLGGYRLMRSEGRLILVTRALQPGRYRVETGSSSTGPFTDSGLGLLARPGRRYFPLPPGQHAVYRLERVHQALARSTRPVTTTP